MATRRTEQNERDGIAQERHTHTDKFVTFDWQPKRTVQFVCRRETGIFNGAVSSLCAQWDGRQLDNNYSVLADAVCTLIKVWPTKALPLISIYSSYKILAHSSRRRWPPCQRPLIVVIHRRNNVKVVHVARMKKKSVFFVVVASTWSTSFLSVLAR